jgi:hypothetical protein
VYFTEHISCVTKNPPWKHDEKLRKLEPWNWRLENKIGFDQQEPSHNCKAGEPSSQRPLAAKTKKKTRTLMQTTRTSRLGRKTNEFNRAGVETLQN